MDRARLDLGEIMNRTRRVSVLMVLALCAAVAVVAQESAAPTATFTTDMLANFDRTGEQLLTLAVATPAEQYAWAPSDAVRTMSEVYMHVVGTNVLLPMALGAAPPEGLEVPEGGPFALLQKWEQEVTAKDDVIARLKDSFEYASAAVPAITDLETEVNLFGFPGTKRAYLLILLTHAHEHLGQAVAYARSVGVVPPWSQQQGDGGGQ